MSKLSKSVRRPSPAMIVAIIALVGALAGSAVALPGKNTVQSNDIKKNAVKSKHLKNNGVKGIDIDESSLGTVPSATNAVNARNAENARNAVNAVNAVNLVSHARIAQFLGEGTHTLGTIGPFELIGDCTVEGGGNDTAVLQIETSTNDSALVSDTSTDLDFDTADNPQDLNAASAASGSRDLSGTATALLAIAANGTTITSADYFAGVNVGGQADMCYFGGTFEQLK